MKTEIVSAYIENLKNHPNLIEYMYMFDSNQNAKKESIKIVEDYIDKNNLEKMFITLENFLTKKNYLIFKESKMIKQDNILNLEYNGLSFSAGLSPMNLIAVVDFKYNSKNLYINMELVDCYDRVNDLTFKKNLPSRLKININTDEIQNKLIVNILHTMIQNTFKKHENVFIGKLGVFHDTIELIRNLKNIEKPFPKDYSFLFNALGNKEKNGHLKIYPEDILKEISKYEEFMKLLYDDNTLKNNIESIKKNLENINQTKQRKLNGNKNA